MHDIKYPTSSTLQGQHKQVLFNDFDSMLLSSLHFFSISIQPPIFEGVFLQKTLFKLTIFRVHVLSFRTRKILLGQGDCPQQSPQYCFQFFSCRFPSVEYVSITYFLIVMSLFCKEKKSFFSALYSLTHCTFVPHT